MSRSAEQIALLRGQILQTEFIIRKAVTNRSIWPVDRHIGARPFVNPPRKRSNSFTGGSVQIPRTMVMTKHLIPNTNNNG